MPYKEEYDILNLLINQSNNQLVTSDILSIQRLSTKEPMYLLYCADDLTKTKVLSVEFLEIDGRKFLLQDIGGSQRSWIWKFSCPCIYTWDSILSVRKGT